MAEQEFTFDKGMYKLAIWVLTCFVFQACSQNQFNTAKDTAEILKLHEEQRNFHFKKMAPEFAALMGPNYISVNRGIISQPSTAENTERFSNYFNSVEFEKWDDLKPPVIRFSDDHSIAYTIVDKEVILHYEGDEGEQIRDTSHFAWLAIYKKHEGVWKIDCVASTNEPK